MFALPLALAALLISADDPAAKAGPSKSAQRAAERAARPAPEAAPSPEDAGRLLVEQKCGKCHDASRARTSELSDAGWRAHMKRMGKLPGAAITEEQAQQIHAYLKSIAEKAVAIDRPIAQTPSGAPPSPNAAIAPDPSR